MERYVIGIDLGASLIKYSTMDMAGRMGDIRRVPTYGELGPEMVLNQIHSVVDKAKNGMPESAKPAGIGIGTPGLIDSNGKIVGEAVNIPGWRDVDLQGIVTEREHTPVLVENDVTLTALGEFEYGAGKKADNLVCISIGTGVGGGIVINGELYSGGFGFAAEIGHMIVEPGGIGCDCGQSGCLEQYSSATGLVNNCIRMASKFHSELAELCLKDPDAVSAERIYHYVQSGDKLALEAHYLLCRMLARAIGIIMSILAPDMIVLSGGVMESGDLIIPEVLSVLPECSIPIIAERSHVLAGKLGADAGVIGAAHYAFSRFIKNRNLKQ